MRPFEHAYEGGKLTFPNVILALLNELDSTDQRLLTGDDVQDWPDAAISAFEEYGVLKPSSLASVISCRECFDEHEITNIPDNLGNFHAFITCPDNPTIGYISITRNQLRTWTLHASALASLLCKKLKCGSSPATIVSERLWHLGRIAASGQQFKIYMAKGAAWINDTNPFDKENFANSFVLTLCQMPHHCFPANAHTIPISDLLTVSDGLLVVRRNVIDDKIALLKNAAITEAPSRPGAELRKAEYAKIFVIDPDNSTVYLRGKAFKLSQKRWRAVIYLYERAVAGYPEVNNVQLIDTISQSDSSNLRDFFRGLNDWKELIVATKRGHCKLNLD